MNKLFFLFHEGFRNVWRHKLTAFTAVISVFLALLIIGLFVVVQQNSHHLIDKIRSEYKIEVFFIDQISDAEEQETIEHLKGFEGINSVRLISKEDALKIYQDEFGEDLIAILGYNPLPASAILGLEKSGSGKMDVSPLISSIEQLPNIDEVVYEGTLIRRVEYFYNTLLKIVSYIGFGLLIVTIIVISNTVKLSVYAKQELIKNLKSIGATNRFIKTPFIIEGILEGIIGAIFSIAAIFLIVNSVNKYFSDIVTFSIEFNLIGIAWIIAISVTIGFIGSYRGIRVLLK